MANEMQYCYFLNTRSGVVNQIINDLQKILFKKTNINEIDHKKFLIKNLGVLKDILSES